MNAERRIPFFLFLVCLVAVMPFSWGAGGIASSSLARQNRLTGGESTDVSTKVTLCHIPPGHPSNAQTITVGQAAVAAHLAHGDSLGECPGAGCRVPAAVGKTGQTQCWGEYGDPISCVGTGQDGEFQKGISVNPRFADNGDGTVRDDLTGLIWLKDASCLGYLPWANALSAANALASGVCGLTDGSVARNWRLPNVKELQSLLDYGSPVSALPPGHPFIGVQQSGGYWSSTSSAAYPNYAFYALPYSGDIFDGRKSVSLNVWAVRSGQ